MNRILHTVLVYSLIVGFGNACFGGSIWAYEKDCGMKRKGSDESAEHVIQIKEEEGEKAEVVKDPVCGMEVRTPEKALSAEYEGKVYYFCSNYCQKTFKKTPKAYVPYDPSEYEEIKGYMQ